MRRQLKLDEANEKSDSFEAASGSARDQSAGKRHTGTALAAPAGHKVLPPVVDGERGLEIAGHSRNSAAVRHTGSGALAIRGGRLPGGGAAKPL